MPNRKVLQMAAESRRQQRKSARRLYRRYREQVPALIRQLAGPAQADHDRAFDLLSRMGATVVSELLEALSGPSLDAVVADEVVSLLGLTGNERARAPLWAFFQANRDNPERASTAALSLAGLGDARVLPYVRKALEAEDEELVFNAAAAMIILGELEDVDRLRAVHRRHLLNQEIRVGVANAVLTILGETDETTFNRTLDEIQISSTDRVLWTDIWRILDEQFGGRR